MYRKELQLGKQTPKIVLEYHDKYFDQTDSTGIKLYHTYKISIVPSGGITAITGERVIHTAAGDCLIFRPDEVHFGRILTAGNYQYLDILIPTDFFDALVLDCSAIVAFLEHRNGANLLCPTENERGHILELCENITNMLRQDTTGNAEPRLFVTVMELLLLCADIYADNENRSAYLPPSPNCVTKTLQYISQHLSERITLEMLAKNASCSVTYLSKLFKRHVGVTVIEHLTARRILHAKKLLQTDQNVTEVCYACGFCDCSHFIKTFKRYNGLTPYEYRKTHFKK